MTFEEFAKEYPEKLEYDELKLIYDSVQRGLKDAQEGNVSRFNPK